MPTAAHLIFSFASVDLNKFIKFDDVFFLVFEFKIQNPSKTMVTEVKLTEKEKNRKLNDLLDALEFNQVRNGQGMSTMSGWQGHG